MENPKAKNTRKKVVTQPQKLPIPTSTVFHVEPRQTEQKLSRSLLPFTQKRTHTYSRVFAIWNRIISSLDDDDMSRQWPFCFLRSFDRFVLYKKTNPCIFCTTRNNTMRSFSILALATRLSSVHGWMPRSQRVVSLVRLSMADTPEPATTEDPCWQDLYDDDCHMSSVYQASFVAGKSINGCYVKTRFDQAHFCLLWICQENGSSPCPAHLDWMRLVQYLHSHLSQALLSFSYIHTTNLTYAGLRHGRPRRSRCQA